MASSVTKRSSSAADLYSCAPSGDLVSHSYVVVIDRALFDCSPMHFRSTLVIVAVSCLVPSSTSS